MNIDEKIRQISVSLIKISVYVRRIELKKRLENLCFQVIEDVIGRNFDFAIKNLSITEYLISFGRTIYEIEPINAEYIISEIKALVSEINKIRGLSAPNLYNDSEILEFISNHQDNLKENKKIITKLDKSSINRDKSTKDLPDNNPATMPDNLANHINRYDNQEKMLKYDDPAIRQSTIIDIIRQSGKQLQLKEIIAILPQVSERTLRYDLQKACNQGILEKIGSGPATSYRIRII